MKDRIDIPRKDLDQAAESIMSGMHYRKAAKSIGVSAYCLRQNFERNGMDISPGRRARGPYNKHVSTEPTRDQRTDKTWNHARCVEMLSKSLRAAQ